MTPPRLGFIGIGWIGEMRLESVHAAGLAVVEAICDASADRLEAVGSRHPDAARFMDHETMFSSAGRLALDGVVIATPNALHAPQAVAALDRGLAVFCQKPLALDAGETRTLVDAALAADLLLGVDYSYRHTDGIQALREILARGGLGRVFHVESVFHNAYGPDKAWCRDPALAGGGALMDLGVHQLDLPLWLLGFPALREVRGRVYRDGQPLTTAGIDDYAVARLELEDGVTVDAAVSWNAHAGADCVIRTTLHGTDGSAEFRNIDGGFFDFELALHSGRSSRIVCRETREWLGRGINRWAERLAVDSSFDREVAGSVVVAEAIDGIYGRLQPAIG